MCHFFDFELALRGDPVVTRSGREVESIEFTGAYFVDEPCVFVKFKGSNHLHPYPIDGSFNYNWREPHPLDLRML